MPCVKRVVIAAAGVGSRLGQGMPKCLVRVNGRPIFEYQLELFRDVGEIRMVVGFQAEAVMEAVRRVRPDVIFVQNPDFGTTSTLQSLYLGSRGIRGKCLFLDGDMILSRRTLLRIEEQCAADKEFIGISDDISQEPVYAVTEQKDGQLFVTGFSRAGEQPWEWANTAYVDTSRLADENTHFFVRLQKYLPFQAVKTDRLEVDTKEDLAYAESFLKKHAEEWGIRA